MPSRPTLSAHRGSADELEPRRAAILEAVVTEYVGTAAPVGSASVVGMPGVNVSSATVRSDMAALERDGYLAQPHTSAGRVPTDKGYRFFVDHLAPNGLMGAVERQRVRRFFDRVHGEMEDMLERASGLLAELTPYAAVVVSPSHDSATLRSLHLVSLAPRRLLLVAVLSDGTVEKRSVETEEVLGDDKIAEVNVTLSKIAIGSDLQSASKLVGDQSGLSFSTFADALQDIAIAEANEQVFMGGSSKLAQSFEAVETVRSVFSILEKQLVVVALLRDVLDRGLSVAIGAEHGYEPLASCAVVVAPVSVGGNETGAIGLLGPTRMNYPRALGVAHLVSSELTERMTLAMTPESGDVDGDD
ncbi:MAG: heat-inducible transcriptional repressor HrcA [Acidimicrobiales bacterium]